MSKKELIVCMIGGMISYWLLEKIEEHVRFKKNMDYLRTNLKDDYRKTYRSQLENLNALSEE